MQSKLNMDREISGCPRLGILGDPATRFGHPSSENFCHSVDPPGRVDLAYQRLTCLGSEFKNCPVYGEDWGGPLPSGIRMDSDSESTRNPLPLRFWILTALVVVLGLVLAGIFFWPGFNQSRAISVTLPDRTATERPTRSSVAEEALPNTSTATPIPTLSPSHSPTTMATSAGLVHTETATNTPSSPSTEPSPGPDLMTPFGPDAEYVFHQVQPGESLPRLATSYQTTKDAIVMVNGLQPNQPLQPGQLILVTWPVEGREIVALQTLVIEEETAVATLAAQYQVLEADLRLYNDLGSLANIPAGRRLILPPEASPNNVSAEPFGPNGEYLLHKVRPGDSVPTLEKQYQTSAEVIRKTNSIIGSLQVDQVVLIVVGETDPANVQPFKIIYVEKETTISNLVTYYRTMEYDLIYYNELNAEEPVPAGRWLIYPTVEE